MADIRIDTLPVADYQLPTDMFAFQREVAGVWTDYRTNFSAFGGDVQITIVTWDLSVPINQVVITPGVDQLGIYLGAVLRYDAPVSPTDAALTITIDQVSNALTLMDFVANSQSGAIAARDESVVNTLDDPITVTQSGAAATGSATLLIQYLIVRL